MGRIATENHSPQKPAIAASSRECERSRSQHLYAVFWVSNWFGQSVMTEQPRDFESDEVLTHKYGRGESGMEIRWQ